MSLVQVQRSPSPSVDDETESSEPNDSRCSSRNRALSECYFAVRGAAVILPHRFFDETSPSCSHSSAQSVEIEGHLQLMMRILRPQDTITMAVRLQTQIVDHIRYLAVVSTCDADRRILLIGMDYMSGQMSVGVVLPLLWCSRVELASDGGVTVHGSSQACSKADNALLFRPVSVQAMWFVFQALHKELEATRQSARRLKEPAPATEYYMDRINSKDFLCAQWQQSPLDLEEEYDLKADTIRAYTLDEEEQAKESFLRRELRYIMQSVDLDSVTSKDIRKQLEERCGSIDVHKEFVDQEMLVILGQMDKPSVIFPYLMLGSEWNASNWDELKANKDSGKVCLVHCKKGISRSSSTVIAYAMKEYGWRLEEALDFVKNRRNCITPNAGFMEQLRMFDGALEASRNRHTFNGRAPRSQSVSCRTPRNPATDTTVRVIVRTFETMRDSSDPARHTFPLDAIAKRTSLPQMS